MKIRSITNTHLSRAGLGVGADAVVALLPPDPLQGGDAAIAADASHGAQGPAHACVELLQGAKHIPVNVQVLNAGAALASLHNAMIC